MHLLAEETMASKSTLSGSTGTAPKADILSIKSLRPAVLTTAPISSNGFKIPELVSQ